ACSRAGMSAALACGPAAQIIRSRRRAPDLARVFTPPNLRTLRPVLVPGPRLEIAQLFGGHPVELGEELHDVIVGIAVIDRNVMADDVAHRAPQDRTLVLAERLAGVVHMRPVGKLEGDVVHEGARPGAEIDGVMIRAAAHEDEEVLDPVRDPETERL